MKNLLTIISGLTWYWLSPYAVVAQDTTPRGPAQWTATNWLGFCIQIVLFILVIIGIYKLALGGKGKSEDTISDISNRDSIPKKPVPGEVREET